MTVFEIYASFGAAWALFRIIDTARFISKYEVDPSIKCPKTRAKQKESMRKMAEIDSTAPIVLSTAIKAFALVALASVHGALWPVMVLRYISQRVG